ncbi:MAG: head-tail connector protein [Rhodobacteraceae bacterium]|nr:head-tail connector protein [Paracoccaceae bacterium]
MSLTLVTPPAALPVELDTMRGHLRVEEGQEEVYLTHCLTTATAQLDGDNGELGCALLHQTWAERFPPVRTGRTAVCLSLHPVVTLQAVEYRDAAGAWQSADLGAFELFEEDGRFWVQSKSWPTPGAYPKPLRLTYRAGFGATGADIPSPLVHAVLLLAAHFYENREPVVMDGTPVEMPRSVDALIAPYKVWWR